MTPLGSGVDEEAFKAVSVFGRPPEPTQVGGADRHCQRPPAPRGVDDIAIGELGDR